MIINLFCIDKIDYALIANISIARILKKYPLPEKQGTNVRPMTND